jgi:peptide/nickel transport system substrate-binding protein
MPRFRNAVAVLLTTAAVALSMVIVSPAGAASKANPNATVTISLGLAPTSLDIEAVAGAALDQVLIGNIYQGLLNINDSGKVVPALATSYAVSPDGLTYTFQLVQNATFHDGSPVTSADVVWSFDQIIAPDATNPDASEFAAVGSVAAQGPDTVVVTLKHRDTLFPYELTDREGLVFKQGTNFAATNNTENGSGPFTLQSFNQGTSVTFVRNEHYWGTEPKVAKVVFEYITTPNTANNAEQTGSTDVENNVEPQLLKPFKNSNYTITQGTSNDKYTLAFNNTYGPLKNVKVRTAIREAINKPGLISSQSGGGVLGGILVGSYVPPGVPWYQNLTSIDKYNPEQAKKLLAQAGYAHGLTLTLSVPNIYPSTVNEYVAAELKQVGITLKIDQIEFATWLTQVYEGKKFQVSLVDQAEAYDLYNYATPSYYWNYDNAQVQQWYNDGVEATTDAERNTDFEKVARAISEQAVSDWLFIGKPITVIRKGVSGVPRNNVNDRYEVANVTVASS